MRLEGASGSQDEGEEEDYVDVDEDTTVAEDKEVVMRCKTNCAGRTPLFTASHRFE